MLNYKTFMLREVFEVVFSDVWKHRKTWLMACPETGEENQIGPHLSQVFEQKLWSRSHQKYSGNISTEGGQTWGSQDYNHNYTTVYSDNKSTIPAATCNTNTWTLLWVEMSHHDWSSASISYRLMVWLGHAISVASNLACTLVHYRQFMAIKVKLS